MPTTNQTIAPAADLALVSRSCAAESVCACGPDCQCGDNCRCTTEANCAPN